MSLPYEPVDALTCRQVREIDVLAIEHVGLPGVVLMENAGAAIAEFIYQLLPNPRRARVVVLCGPGNNGGDGFVIARRLHNAAVDALVVLATPAERCRGDAAINLQVLLRSGPTVVDASDGSRMAEIATALENADVVVDALLGTGSGGDPRGVVAELITLANAARRPRRVAVDIPSGLNADTGAVGTPCFVADATVTLLAPKTGFDAEAARAVCGRVVTADIGAPRNLIPRTRKREEGVDR